VVSGLKQWISEILECVEPGVDIELNPDHEYRELMALYKKLEVAVKTGIAYRDEIKEIMTTVGKSSSKASKPKVITGPSQFQKAHNAPGVELDFNVGV